MLTLIPLISSLRRPLLERVPALRLVGALLAGTCLAVGATPLAPVPQALGKAETIVALPSGWLSMESRALVLRDAQGQERDRLPIRGGALDAREDAHGVRAWVLDANTQRTVPVDVDIHAGTLTAREPLGAAPFAVKALCAYRDALGHDFLFFVAKDGQAEQWLLHAGQARRYRSLSLPPGVESCRVEDASGTLFVAEKGFGAWAYAIGGERVPERQPVLLRKPYGPLSGGAAAVAVVPGGVAVLAADGKAVHWARLQKNQWQQVAVRKLAAQADAGAQPLVVHSGSSQVTMLWRAAGNRPQWHALGQPWSLVAKAPQAAAVVAPSGQTAPVARKGDAADDPAIWLHPQDLGSSLILGTNKKQGLLVYDLQGRERQLLDAGRLNNVDLRQNVRFADGRFDLAVATQRDDLSLVLFTIAGDGMVSEAARLPTGLPNIYGVCLYQPPHGGLEVFVNDKDGRLQHYRIERSAGQWASRLLRTLRLSSQPEGCVVDDAQGRLFVGEEDVGVWVTHADADAPAPWQSVLSVGPLLRADVEGLALYHGKSGSYLIVSSQGNDSYVVLDAAPPYRHRGTFRIGINAADEIDGTSDTDGLEATAANLGGPYGQGLLVVQDGHKRLPDGAQNFKLVPWAEVTKALGLP